MILGLVVLHNGMGYLLGYWASRIFHLAEIDCRAVSIEVGMQNSGLGVACDPFCRVSHYCGSKCHFQPMA